MKRLIFLLLLIPINVFAVNYSPYSEYKYTDNYVKENENCQVEELKKYKFYKLDKDYTSNYYNYDYKDDYYIYRDTEYIYSDLITSDVKPNVNEVIEFEEKKYTYYQEYRKLRYIVFYNFDYSNYLMLKEIKIYDKNNKSVNFEIIKGSSVIDDYDRNTSVKIDKDDVIILKFKKDMAFDDFNINIYVAGQYTKTFSFDYNVNYTGELSDKSYYGSISGQLSSEEHYRIDTNNSSYKEELDSEIKVKEGYFDNIDNAKIIRYETVYNYKEKLYKYYNYKRVYLDDYYFEKEDYIKDLNNYKLVYRYRCRSILNNVVSSDKIGYKSKEEYLELKNNRENIINKLNTSKNSDVLLIESVSNEIDISNKEIENTKYCKFEIKTNNEDNDKINDNSSKIIKLIITILGLLIIFIV